MVKGRIQAIHHTGSLECRACACACLERFKLQSQSCNAVQRFAAVRFKGGNLTAVMAILVGGYKLNNHETIVVLLCKTDRHIVPVLQLQVTGQHATEARGCRARAEKRCGVVQNRQQRSVGTE